MKKFIGFLTRLSTELLFHPFQPFMFGQKSLAPKMALLFKIPLIFYGENEAEYGNPIEDTESAIRDWSYFTSENSDNVSLGGVSVTNLIDYFGIKKMIFILICLPIQIKYLRIKYRFIILVTITNGIHNLVIIMLLKMEDLLLHQNEHQEHILNIIIV